jgi:hypothetical protein
MDIEAAIKSGAEVRRKRIEGLSFFDANLWLGTPSFFPLASELQPGAVKDALQEYALQGALVSHWDAVRLSAQEGNQGLIEAGAVLPPEVYTVWTGLPTAMPEQDPLPGPGRGGPERGRSARGRPGSGRPSGGKRGADGPDPRLRGVRLFPKTHQFRLAAWVVGELCEWCIEHQVPLFVWHVEAEWGSLQALAAAFPRLAIVIESQWQKILYHNRDLFSLLASCPNVFLESSNFIGQDNVTAFVRRFGPERLLWGSFLPVNDPYASMGMLLDADISEADKRLVAGGNLRRLIAEVKP